MTHSSSDPIITARRPIQPPRWVRVLAGIFLSLAGAGGLIATLLATFARGPWDRPLLSFGIGSALMFTGGGVCLLTVGAGLLLEATQTRPKP